VLAAHEVEAIDEVWINDYCIPVDALNSSGLATTGRYANVIRIRKMLGSTSQPADAVTVSEISEWTSSHKLQGLAYIMVRMEYNQDKFPGGTPNLTAFIRGKKIFDSRIGIAAFTTNAVLFQYDYFSNDSYGVNAASKIDDTVLQASANIADEIVAVASKVYTTSSISASTNAATLSGSSPMLELQRGDRVQVSTAGSLPGGLSAATDYYVIPYQFKDTPRLQFAVSLHNAMVGIPIDLSSAGSGSMTITKTGEPRYHGGGVIDTENMIEDNINDLLTASGGRAIYVGGKWKIKAAAYEAPAFDIGPGDIVDTMTVRTRLSRRDRFTGIKGVYRSPLNLENPADYPAMVSSTFASIDGQEILRDMDTPLTQRPQTSRRIAKIELLKARQEITIRLICNLRAMRAQCGSTVTVTFPRYGWDEKVFEVTNWSLVPRNDNGTPSLAIGLDLRETAPEVFDWETSEESEIDPAPNSTLPNPFDVSAPTGVAFNSRPVFSLEGDTIYIIGLEWDSHPDAFVTGGGQFEVQFKKTADPNWLPSFFVDGEQNASDITQASAGEQYDVRIRAWNNLAPGVRSEWVSLLGLYAGSGGGVSDSEDWGLFSEAGGDGDEDYGSWDTVGDPVSATDDYGAYT